MFCLNQYTQYLIQGDQRACYQLIDQYLKETSADTEESAHIKALYFDVFQPSMKEIGQLWATNKISVAQEHVATAITQHMMASLYSRIFEATVKAVSKKVVISCPASELHELPSRMLADLLVLEGLDVIFVGANSPADDLLELIALEKPDALIVSCTITRHLTEVKHLLSKLRNSDTVQPLVLVGGYAFDQDPSQTAVVGADYYCATFQESIQVILHQEAPCHQVG